MSADLAERLRALAHDYHDGRLDLAAYRSLRAPLLDSLALNGTSVPAEMEVTQPRMVARTGEWRQPADDASRTSGQWPKLPVDTPRSADASRTSGQWPKPSGEALRGARQSHASDSPERVSESSSEKPARAPKSLLPLIAGAFALVVIVAALSWMWRNHAAQSESSANESESGSAAAGARATDRVRDLVQPFVDRGDWSDARLTTLSAALLELGGSQIAVVADESWFQRFVDELRKRLKEQQALATTTLTADNSPLAALAVTVGLDLNSPDAAIHVAALPPPPAPEAEPSTVEPPKAANKNTEGTAAPSGVRAMSGPHEEGAGTPSHGPDASPMSPTASAQGESVATGSARSSSAQGVPVASATAASMNRPSNTGPVAANDATDENTCRIELIQTRRPLCHDTLPAGIAEGKGKNISGVGAEGPTLALVPAGTFEMGSTAAPEEQPVHRVTIREPFAISVNEVSQGEFKIYCEHAAKACASQPWSGDDYPVVNVSWDDARAYAEWLSQVTHHRYALPTEAQWEYAARAGQTGLYPSGDALSPTDAYFSIHAKQTSAARRSQKFNANAFRLVHTVGNVREWVEDPWTASFAGAPGDGSAARSGAAAAMRVARGGSYTDGTTRLRLSLREGVNANTRDVVTGFRIVRELP